MSYGRWGRISIVTGSNPTTGSESQYVIPSTSIFKIKSIHLTMDASSGSSGTARSPYIEITGSTGLSLFKVYSGKDYSSGSGTTEYYWISGLGDSSSFTGSGLAVKPFPIDVMLDSGYVIRTNTTNFDDEDNWSYPIIFVEEWMKDSV